MNIDKYKAFVFDLDGTLAESKSPLEQPMSDFLCRLLKNRKDVGIISGGWMPQFEKQFLAHFNCDKALWSHLYIMPTSGASMQKWNGDDWEELYANHISRDEYERILKVYDEIFTRTSFERPIAKWGEQIEYRENAVTFSALGQKAPPEEKKKWGGDSSNKEKKLEIVRLLEPLLPDYSVKAGGSTSIDITHKGIDKGYGLVKFCEFTGNTKDDTLFVGDALYEGGNDFAVVRTGVDTLAVEGPDDLLEKMGVERASQD